MNAISYFDLNKKLIRSRKKAMRTGVPIVCATQQMKDTDWRCFIGKLKCLVGLHDWSVLQWAVPHCTRRNCYKSKKRK